MKMKNILKTILGNTSNGLSTGYHIIDEKIGGLKKGQVYLIAAGKGQGATSLCLSILQNIAGDGKKAVYFSCNRNEEYVVRRLLSQLTGNAKEIMSGEKLSEDEIERVNEAAQKLKRSKIIINDLQCPDVERLADTMVIYDSYLDSDVCVIDGLQFLTTDKSYLSRKEEYEGIFRELKSFAAMAEIPIIVTCDVTDGIRGRERHIPTIDDIREYGKIADLADVVILLNREQYYDAETEKTGIIDLEFASVDGLHKGSCELIFIPEYLRCYNIEKGCGKNE